MKTGTSEILTFGDVIEKTGGAHSREGRSLLIGNGFSIAYDSARFSWSNIKELLKSQSNCGLKTGELDNWINRYGTEDLESLVRKLADDSQAGDAERLRKAILTAVSSNHPEWKHCRNWDNSDDSKPRAGSEFLAKFKRVYSVNYDLLLHWATWWRNSDANNQPLPRADKIWWDGCTGKNFIRPVSITYSGKIYKWIGEPGHGRQNIFHLHGSIYYFPERNGDQKPVDRALYKLADSHEGIDLVSKGYFPAFVCDGTAEEKMQVIEQYDLLWASFDRLKTEDLPIVTFGFACAKCDKHILLIMAKSKAPAIFIGLHNDNQSLDNQVAEIDRFTDLNTGRDLDKTLLFYDQSDAKAWG